MTPPSPAPLSQRRYAAGVREGLENFIQGQPIRSNDYVMVSDGETQGGSYGATYE